MLKKCYTSYVFGTIPNLVCMLHKFSTLFNNNNAKKIPISHKNTIYLILKVNEYKLKFVLFIVYILI